MTHLFTKLYVMALCTSAVCMLAQEKKLSRAELPQAVAATIDREAKGATIKGYATEREHGKKVYEAETILNGRSRDMQVTAEGTLSEVEEEVRLDELPSSVQAALKKLAGGATINKVESLTKQGKLVAYEASTIKAGHKGEVQVGQAGETLRHEQ